MFQIIMQTNFLFWTHKTFCFICSFEQTKLSQIVHYTVIDITC